MNPCNFSLNIILPCTFENVEKEKNVRDENKYGRGTFIPFTTRAHRLAVKRLRESEAECQRKSWDIYNHSVPTENAGIRQPVSCLPVSFTLGEVLFMYARVVYALQNNTTSGSK